MKKQNVLTNGLRLSALVLFFLLGSMSLFGQTPGDVTGDGMADIVDALQIARAYVGLNPTPYNASLGDVDCSGTVDIVDALQVARYYVGLIDSLGNCGEETATPTPTATATPFVTGTPGTHEHVDNPFANANWYVDPVWSQKAIDGGGAAVANYNTAVWMDRIGAITDGIGLRGHLDAAIEQNADVIIIVIYDLPNRDCAAAASNGELLI